MYKISTLILITIVTLTAQHRPFQEINHEFSSETLWKKYELSNDSIKVNLKNKKITLIDSLFNRHIIIGYFTYGHIFQNPRPKVEMLHPGMWILGEWDDIPKKDLIKTGLFVMVVEDYKVVDYVEYGIDVVGYHPKINDKFHYKILENKIVLSYRTHIYETKYLEYPYPPQCQIIY